MNLMQKRDKPNSNVTLWQQLAALALDRPGATLTFAQRLAEENGWSKAYASRVIEEYKCFLYLIAVTRTPLTPSDTVDQTWHLHLSYTRSYWQDLCKQILGFELHHHPTQGGAAERNRFVAQYQRTLDTYRHLLSGEPPQDIWPPVTERFTEAKGFVRVNTADVWLVREPKTWCRNLVGIAVAAVFLVACTADLTDKGIPFWVKIAIGVWLAYCFLKFLRWLGLGGGRGGGAGGCGADCGGCGGCGND